MVWTTLGGVNGVKVTSKKAGNNNWIFLTAADYRSGTSFDDNGNYGDYWSATACNDDDHAFPFFFCNYDFFGEDETVELSKGIDDDGDQRYRGRIIRPVVK